MSCVEELKVIEREGKRGVYPVRFDCRGGDAGDVNKDYFLALQVLYHKDGFSMGSGDEGILPSKGFSFFLFPP